MNAIGIFRHKDNTLAVFTASMKGDATLVEIANRLEKQNNGEVVGIAEVDENAQYLQQIYNLHSVVRGVTIVSTTYGVKIPEYDCGSYDDYDHEY